MIGPTYAPILGPGALRGLSLIQKYRFLTIPQFAKIANFSYYHSAVVLRRYERRKLVAFFGFVPIPAQGKTPKLYFLTRKGYDLVLAESSHSAEELGPFIPVHQDVSWTPQMYHRLRLLDLFIALEVQVQNLPHIRLIKTFLEYRRIKGSGGIARETTDFVSDRQTSDDRIIPDGAFILENIDSSRRALFFVEMDMATERIAAQRIGDPRATLRRKFQQYDAYLTSGRFATTYQQFGEFRSFTMCLVTFGRERLGNIRLSVSDLPEKLPRYYRLADFQEATADFLGPVWHSRATLDTARYPLVQAP
jgi:hypothetical protein